MFKFSSKLIVKRRKQLKLTYRALAERTVDVDPKKKGVSPMTCKRLEFDRYDPSVRSICLICEAGRSRRSSESCCTRLSNSSRGVKQSP